MSSPILCSSLATKLYRCYYYQEHESYIKYVKSLAEKTIKNSKDDQQNLLKNFCELLTKKSTSIERRIDSNDRELFKSYSIACIVNIQTLLNQFTVTNIYEEVIYKHKLRSIIGGLIKNSGKIIYFSFYNAKETEKRLDIFLLNCYIYNLVGNTKYDYIVMSAPDNIFYTVTFDDGDYTIKNGLRTITSRVKFRNRGEHCLYCVNQCKPNLINGLDRLSILI